jgi:opacity protein-like surface antigen
MKKLLLGAVGVLGLAGSAVAAGQPARGYANAPAPADVAYNWTGFYAGLHAGYGLGGTEWQTMNIQGDGALGGVQFGYNQQIGNLLLGIEGDVSFSGIKGGRTINALNQVVFSQGSSINWLSTVTGRVGFANGRWLAYAKGGAAWANEDHTYDVTLLIPPGGKIALTGHEIRPGWVIGAGMEYALAGNWSVRGEYNFINFPDHGFDLNGTNTTGALVATDASTRQTLHLLKLGVNYQFGAPDAAKPIAPLYYAPTGFNWTGLYVGAQAGAGSNSIAWRDYDPSGKFSTTGGFGGGQIGADVQLGVMVFGVEAEIAGGNIGGSRRFMQDLIAVDLKTRTDWLATATARIGMVTNDRWLTYVKGGIAAAHDQHSLSLAMDPLSADLAGSRIHTGFVIGAGVEYAFASNWSAKLEYNYVELGSDKAVLEGNINVPPMAGPYYLSSTIEQTMQIAKIGVNYRFAP